MISSVISFPGRMAWELTKATHGSRRATEISHFATILLSGTVGYFTPRSSTFRCSITWLVFGGAIYGMIQDEIDPDFNVEQKKQAFRTERLAFGIFFGFCIGLLLKNPEKFPEIFPDGFSIELNSLFDAAKIFPLTFYVFLKTFSKIFPLFGYPFLTALDWFCQPSEYRGERGS